MSRRSPQLLVLAMDIGSSSTRSAFFDQNGRCLETTRASRSYSVEYSSDGGATLSPSLIRKAAVSCVRETLRSRHKSLLARKAPIIGAGASAFWHGLLGLDGKGLPITPIYTWADARCTADAAQLRQEFDEAEIQRRTGCMLRAPFWPAKLRWLQRTQQALFRRVARWTSPAEWIFVEVFGASGCSHSMASATGLYNLRERRWDTTLIEACGVRIDQLAALNDLALVTGKAHSEFHALKIFSAIGDGAAGNLGSGADTSATIAINVGTSAAVRMMEENGSGAIPFGLFRYVVDADRTVVGGAVSNAGNLRQWCLRVLRLDSSPAKVEAALSRIAAASDDTTVLPFWVSERAPSWPEELHGAIIGLTQAVSAAEILRATTCSVFYRLADILDLLDPAGGKPKEVIVSGGILHSSAGVRLLADALGRDLRISTEPEASLRGAAIHVLAQAGHPPASLRAGKRVRHDRSLAGKHRQRRERQVALERTLL
jgi:gluconokinase